MLQDLILKPSQIVPGDHIVVKGRFGKVLKSEISPELLWHAYWIITVQFSKSEIENVSFAIDEEKIRVRPCGFSSRCEEF